MGGIERTCRGHPWARTAVTLDWGNWMAEIVEIVRSILKEVAVNRRNVMLLAAKQRAKFGGWLKFELAAALASREESQRVTLEDQYSTGGRSDLSFKVDGTTWHVEMKTANVNWRADGVESKTRPVTRNVSGIVADITKLRDKCPPARGLAVFAFFPVPLWVWECEREKLLYHLHRIERECDLTRNTLIHNADFVQLADQFGVVFFALEAV